MRKLWISTAVALALLSGAAPAAAEEPAPAAAPEVPAGGLFLPEPEKMYGIIFPGPCTVEVECEDGSVLRCSGNTRCHWYLGNPGPAFVECDGRRNSCPLN